MKKLLIETISLQTPRGRLIFFGLVSLAVFLAPYDLLANLSVWQRIGFESAPSIGLTRAYWHLLHLDVASAWARNPLIFAVLVIGVPLLLRDGLQLFKQSQR